MSNAGGRTPGGCFIYLLGGPSSSFFSAMLRFVAPGGLARRHLCLSLVSPLSLSHVSLISPPCCLERGAGFRGFGACLQNMSPSMRTLSGLHTRAACLWGSFFFYYTSHKFQGCSSLPLLVYYLSCTYYDIYLFDFFLSTVDRFVLFFFSKWRRSGAKKWSGEMRSAFACETMQSCPTIGRLLPSWFHAGLGHWRTCILPPRRSAPRRNTTRCACDRPALRTPLASYVAAMRASVPA